MVPWYAHSNCSYVSDGDIVLYYNTENVMECTLYLVFRSLKIVPWYLEWSHGSVI